MLRTPWSRRVIVGLSALMLAGCQPSEVGTVGRETKPDDALPTGADPAIVKGKNKPASIMETRATRK